MLYEVITVNGPHDGDAGLGQGIHLAGEHHELRQLDLRLQQPLPVDGLAPATAGLEGGRITSYNVCYTKLLRPEANTVLLPLAVSFQAEMLLKAQSRKR